jgi:hypothetical protein
MWIPKLIHCSYVTVKGWAYAVVLAQSLHVLCDDLLSLADDGTGRGVWPLLEQGPRGSAVHRAIAHNGETVCRAHRSLLIGSTDAGLTHTAVTYQTTCRRYPWGPADRSHPACRAS